MNIKTDGPVDLCYSKAEGLSADTISTIGQTIGQVGSSLAQRQKSLSEVEQKCGKKPVLPGKRLNKWNECAIEYAKASSAPVPTIVAPAASTEKKTPTWVWILAGVVGLGAIGFIAYKASKK